MMVKDPVCGMDVDETKAAATSEHAGTRYYFCSPGCKQTFDTAPGNYTPGGSGEHGGHGGHGGHG